MKFIIGKKMAMTQVWDENNQVLAVTPVQAGPCVVTQIKTKDKDGYQAVQLAYGKRKAKNIKKPQLGHLRNLDIKPQYLREFRIDKIEGVKLGDVVSVGTFVVGDKLKVTGTSKGKGFQGVVKRHGFAGFRKTHGNKDQERMPGSIGAKGPAQVFKGTKMSGRMGDARVSVANLEVVQIDEKNNVIFIKGAIPGAINGLILIQANGDLQLNLEPKKIVEKEEKAKIGDKEEAPSTQEGREGANEEEVKTENKEEVLQEGKNKEEVLESKEPVSKEEVSV